MTKTQIFLQNFCHGQICCPKTLESRKKPAENKQTAKAVCYLSRYSYSTVYIYCIIEEPYKHYFTEKVSYSPYLRHGTLSFVSLLYVLSPEMAGQMVVQMRVPEINLAHGLQAQAANDLYRYF